MSNGQSGTQTPPVVIQPQPDQTLVIQPAPTVQVTVTTADPELQASFQQLDQLVRTFDDAIQSLNQSADQKAPVQHLHSIANINGLIEALDGKADQAATVAALDGKASASHSHTIGAVEGLTAALGGKAAASHGHSMGNVAGLVAALDEKAAVAHSHSMDSIANLTAALDGKAAASHGHEMSSITGLVAMLNETASANHGHLMSDVDGLTAALDGKAAASHNHAMGSIEGLTVALDGKAAASHNHSVANVAGLQQTIDSLQSQILTLQAGNGGGSSSASQLNYTASQSTVFGTHTASFAKFTDGTTTTGAATQNGSQSWIQADLGSVKTIERIDLGGGTLAGFGTVAVYLNDRIVQVSLNGSSWANLFIIVGVTDSAIASFAIPICRCRYVRIFGNAHTAVSEFQIWGQ